MQGTITPENKYRIDFDVPCYDVDASFRMKPSAFMDHAQEVAYQCSTAMHFGFDELSTEGKAWVLSRFKYVFVKAPRWRDSVRLETWHKGAAVPFYIRDFAMKSPDGEPLVLGTSSWVVIDVATRALSRSSEVIAMVPDSSMCKEDAIAVPAAKVAFPRGVEGEAAGDRTVSYSDVDVLGHTNNARYVLWAVDCIPMEVSAGMLLREVCVNFNHETRPGEAVSLRRAEAAPSDGGEGGRTFIVEGLRSDGRACFVVRLDYVPDNA